MLFGYYIAKKLARNTQATFTKTVVRLASVAVSISITVVILSFGTLFGFKKEIRDKVSGYAGHITISNFDLSQGNEHSYLQIDSSLLSQVQKLGQVSSVEPFINKAGILKTDSVIEGLIFRGISDSYDLSFYKKHLKRGKLPIYSDTSDSYDVLLSEHTADMLDIDTGDRLDLFFVDQGNVRRRKPKVVGLFNTGLSSFDEQFALADLRMIQRVVGLDYTLASGYEVRTLDFDKIDQTRSAIDQEISATLRAVSVQDQYFTIFQWLRIVDSNVLIIIVLMFVVAMINIITVLLILIIERIPMVGLLKALGSRDRSIMHIFNWQGVFILLSGLLLGNILAFGLAWLQVNYKIIALTPETYYMDAVPFYLPWTYVIGINVATVILAYIFTWLPAMMVSRIDPSKSIQFK